MKIILFVPIQFRPHISLSLCIYMTEEGAVVIIRVLAIHLVYNTILIFVFNFCCKVDENMYRAGLRNAATGQFFHFRKSVDSGSANEYVC